jgi:hypothetical protein
MKSMKYYVTACAGGGNGMAICVAGKLFVGVMSSASVIDGLNIEIIDR